MPTLDFFRNVHIGDTDFFDEGPKLISTVRTGSLQNTSSIDTSTFDAYRQGVELTQLKHFDAGTIKIYAGDPGHILKRSNFGLDGNVFQDYSFFRELDRFVPEDFIKAQTDDSSQGLERLSWPLVVGDNDQLDSYSFNGVIEPLTIRAKASFFSIDVPFEAHDVRGTLMDGNSNTNGGVDKIVTLYTYVTSSEKTPFADEYNSGFHYDNSILSSSSDQPTLLGIFNPDTTTIKPFIDARYVRNTISSASYSSDMIEALSLMSASTANYIDIANNQRSATTGWDYDRNVNIGTDSLAFGGMTY